MHKILIVDDNEGLCKNLSDILELKGYKTASVYSGRQAIESVRNDKFDIVLMDVKMPEMDGIDTLKILRQIAPDTGVVMITAFADDIFYREGLKNSDLTVIQKPMDIDNLLNILSDIISQKKEK